MVLEYCYWIDDDDVTVFVTVIHRDLVKQILFSHNWAISGKTNRCIYLHIKVWLWIPCPCNSPVWSGDWHMTVTNNEKLEAALDRWQRKVLGMCWKDKITNEEVRRRAGKEMLETLLFEEDSLDMYRDTGRLVYQTLKWFHPIFKKKCVHLRMNWKKTECNRLDVFRGNRAVEDHKE